MPFTLLTFIYDNLWWWWWCPGDFLTTTHTSHHQPTSSKHHVTICWGSGSKWLITKLLLYFSLVLIFSDAARILHGYAKKTSASTKRISMRERISIHAWKTLLSKFYDPRPARPEQGAKIRICSWRISRSESSTWLPILSIPAIS